MNQVGHYDHRQYVPVPLYKIHIYIRTIKQTNMPIYIYICIYIYIRTYSYIHTHTYKCVYIYTHMSCDDIISSIISDIEPSRYLQPLAYLRAACCIGYRAGATIGLLWGYYRVVGPCNISSLFRTPKLTGSCD